MRTGVLPSLLLTLLLGATSAANAAPDAQAGQQLPTSSQVATRTGKVNLNTADAQTIQRELVGIGEAKAQAIVAYREANGPFSSVDELLEVKGIGKAILDRNRDQLDIN